MSLALSAAVFLLTLALIFVRPRGMNEATGACIGAVAMLGLRLATPGDFAARLSRGDGRLLLLNVFLLGTLVTAFLSLEVTPIVYALTERLEIEPLPCLLACAFSPSILACFVIFRRQLPRRFAMTALTDDAPSHGFAINAVGLGLVLAAFHAFGLLGVPLAIPACIGAVVLGMIAAAKRTVTGRNLVGSVSRSLFPL